VFLPPWAAVLPEDGEVGDASEKEEKGEVGDAIEPDEEDGDEEEEEVGDANLSAAIMALYNPCPVCIKTHTFLGDF
jgi:hypothetical protein